MKSVTFIAIAHLLAVSTWVHSAPPDGAVPPNVAATASEVKVEKVEKVEHQEDKQEKILVKAEKRSANSAQPGGGAKGPMSPTQ